MHPVAWIAWSLCAALATMATTNPFYLVPIVAAAWAVHATHHRTGPNARSFRIFLVVGGVTMLTRTALVLFVPTEVTRGALALAFLEGSRLAVLLIVFGAFNSVADPFGVLRLAPRRFHEPALAAALALSIAPRTIAAAARVRRAQRMRGLSLGGMRSWPALAVPVLETGMEEAVTLAESMDARGHGRGRRSRYRPDVWSGRSLIVVVSSAAGALAFVAAFFGGGETLTVSTFPLEWPQVSGALVAAALLLAVPAFLEDGDG